MDENPEFSALDPELLEEGEEERVKVSDYGRVVVPNKEYLKEKTRGLDKDQREKHSEHIKEVKRQVLPFLEDVTEERFYVEEIRRQMDLEQVAMEVAAGKELDNMEALDAEVSGYLESYDDNSQTMMKHLA